MFRKLTIALAASAALSIPALAPTSASAGWHGGFHGGFHGGYFHRGWGFAGLGYGGGPGWCYYHPYRCGRF
jgi:hypothetical protein